jgi:hypothetical protein
MHAIKVEWGVTSRKPENVKVERPFGGFLARKTALTVFMSEDNEIVGIAVTLVEIRPQGVSPVALLAGHMKASHDTVTDKVTKCYRLTKTGGLGKAHRKCTCPYLTRRV